MLDADRVDDKAAINRGDDALLPSLQRVKARTQDLDEDARLTALALAALQVWSAGQAETPELADVAAVNAGLFPSYTGGPYTYLHQAGAARVRAQAQAAAVRDPALFTVPAALDDFLSRTTAP